MAFGADTTTDEVLAGIDLKGKQALVTGGSTSRQTGITNGHRVWKRQPDGGLSALGTSPLIAAGRRCVRGFGSGTAPISARV